MALIAVLILLFSAWMLWGWLVGENREILWMRNWCAISFVISALLISAGTGIGITVAVSRSQHRAEVRAFAEALERQLAAGRADKARQHLQKVIDRPDEWSSDSNDLLERMTAETARMQSSGPQQAAGRAAGTLPVSRPSSGRTPAGRQQTTSTADDTMTR
jgi:hypothetical protein